MRRNDVTQMTPAEKAIMAAMDAVESAGCHPKLTNAVVLLQQVRDEVADFVELPAYAQQCMQAAIEPQRDVCY